MACQFQPIERRRFLREGALACSAVLIPGCSGAGFGTAIRRPPDCPAPVNAASNRLIRELVGLRPYRRGGFVVRAEPLGDKRLVHNYGHGGAGITLSWGSSRLATQLGLPGHRGPVAVIGAGIMGLTTARLVQEAGFAVTIHAAALPPETTSDVAGAGWYPSSLFRADAVDGAFRAQLAAAVLHSYRRFQLLAGPEYGVRWASNYELYSTPAPPKASDPSFSELMRPLLPEVAELQPGEHPFGVYHARRYAGMVIEPPRLLRQLLRDFQQAGGIVEVRRFSSPAEIAALPQSLLFNCTGLGSLDLFGDSELRPMRGQLAVLLPQPEVDYSLTEENGFYMFPRSDGIVLGGTHELDDWNLEPDPATTRRLIAGHRRIFSAISCAHYRG